MILSGTNFETISFGANVFVGVSFSLALTKGAIPVDPDFEFELEEGVEEVVEDDVEAVGD
jgi:hypothetical protein